MFKKRRHLPNTRLWGKVRKTPCLCDAYHLKEEDRYWGHISSYRIIGRVADNSKLEDDFWTEMTPPPILFPFKPESGQGGEGKSHDAHRQYHLELLQPVFPVQCEHGNVINTSAGFCGSRPCFAVLEAQFSRLLSNLSTLYIRIFVILSVLSSSGWFDPIWLPYLPGWLLEA